MASDLARGLHPMFGMNTESLQSLKAQLERELRDAERGLAARTLAAQSRYANALYELDRVEHLIRRYEDRHHGFDAHLAG